jgi:hypothetical protein
MKSFKNFLQFSFVIAIAAFMTVSCASDQTETTVESMPNIESNEDITTRAVKKRVDSKAYYYKSLAEFKKGQATVDLAQLADLQGKQVNFVVIYDAIAPWAEGFAEGNVKTTGDDMLNGLMDSYELEIVKQFEIDDTNEGFVLEPNTMLENAVETAREISMIEHILMVQVKEVPSDVTETETAANN